MKPAIAPLWLRAYTATSCIGRGGQDRDLQSIQTAPRVTVTDFGQELERAGIHLDIQLAKAALRIIQSGIHHADKVFSG